MTHPLTGEVLLRSALAQNSTLQVGDPIGVFFDPMDENRFVIDMPWEKKDEKQKEYNGF